METLETPWGSWWLIVDSRLRGCGAAVDAEMVVMEDVGDVAARQRFALAAVRAWVLGNTDGPSGGERGSSR